MNRESIKLLIRRFVLATSFPPFLGVYRWGYRLVTGLAVRIFRRYPGVRAVYLRRGGAKGAITPLVSDIDFAVIIDSLTEDESRELHDSYDRLARVTTLLDRSLEIYSEAQMKHLYETNDYFRYRFVEGKETWKLLYGQNVLECLPECSMEELHGGFVNETKVWWSLFAWRFYHDRKYNDEGVTRNSFCFKTVSEILKMNLALNHGRLTFDRSEAMRDALPDLDQEDSRLVEDLLTIERSGFRKNDSGILERTNRFLIRYLDRFFRVLQDHPIAASRNGVTQVVSGAGDPIFQSSAEKDHLDRLRSFIRDRWGVKGSATHVSSGAFFNLDEILFLVEIDARTPPSVTEIAALNRYHQSMGGELCSRVKIFLLTSGAAFQIDTEDLSQSWQSVLIPASNPDVFEIIHSHASEAGMGMTSSRRVVAWSSLVEHFFREEKSLFYELIDQPSIYKLGGRDFLRIFWKTAQLVVLNRSAARGTVVYALAPDQVAAALADEGIPLPDRLGRLQTAYAIELKGEDGGVAPLVPEALRWLKEIES